MLFCHLLYIVQILHFPMLYSSVLIVHSIRSIFFIEDGLKKVLIPSMLWHLGISLWGAQGIVIGGADRCLHPTYHLVPDDYQMSSISWKIQIDILKDWMYWQGGLTNMTREETKLELFNLKESVRPLKLVWGKLAENVSN